MSNYVISGALRDPQVLACVLGRVLGNEVTPEAVELPGVALCLHGPAEQPVLVPAEASSQLPALLLRDLPAEALERLKHYEASFGAQPEDRVLEVAGTALPVQLSLVATPSDPARLSEGDFAAWCDTWAPIARRMAEEIMAYMGRKTGAELNRSILPVRMRASSWLRAQEGVEDPEFPLAEAVEVVDHKRAYSNWFAMEEMDLRYRKFNGEMSPVINRAAKLLGHAAIVLPYDPVLDAVLLVQQFRAAPYIAGERQPWLWEAPAGMVDPGETPQQAALREAEEEAGLKIRHLDFVGALYCTPGASGEKDYCFIGITDVREIAGGGGLPGEGEDIRSKVISFQELMDAVDKHSYLSMPVVTSALWLARHRDRLRAMV